jgi:hypothetical protein
VSTQAQSKKGDTEDIIAQPKQSTGSNGKQRSGGILQTYQSEESRHSFGSMDTPYLEKESIDEMCDGCLQKKRAIRDLELRAERLEAAVQDLELKVVSKTGKI